MAAHTRQHYMRNPQKVIDRVADYNARKESAAGYMTNSERVRKQRLYGDRCYFCGVHLSGSGEWDHATPLIRGGTNWPSNMLLVCLTCNRDKHSKTELEYVQWMRERGRPFRFDSESRPE